MASAPPRPPNTTKRTGCGCGCVGGALLGVGLAAFGGVAVLGSSYIGLVLTGSMATTFGLLGVIMGVGLVRQGMRVDRVLDGEDLVAAWSWPASGDRPAGQVHIAHAGVFRDGVYTEWSSAFVLMDVTLEDGELVFEYDIVRNSARTLYHHVRKRLRVPVPPEAEADARRVVEELGSRPADT